MPILYTFSSWDRLAPAIRIPADWMGGGGIHSPQGFRSRPYASPNFLKREFQGGGAFGSFRVSGHCGRRHRESGSVKNIFTGWSVVRPGGHWRPAQPAAPPLTWGHFWGHSGRSNLVDWLLERVSGHYLNASLPPEIPLSAHCRNTGLHGFCACGFCQSKYPPDQGRLC